MDRTWVKEQADRKGVRLKEVAAAMHVPQPRLSELFSGKRRLYAGQALRMARFLDVPVEEVIERAGKAAN